MKKSILRIIAASALCLAIATPGCSSKPQESAAPSVEASASQTAAPTPAPESQDTAPAEETSTQQTTFFTSPLDKEVVVGDIAFPYSSAWIRNDTGDTIEFTSEGKYPDMISITARPILNDSFEDLDAEQTAEAFKVTAQAAAADADAELDTTEQGAIGSYPGLLYAFSSPENETRVIGIYATDGKTMYDLCATAAAGYAGSSAKAEDAENLIRDMSFMAKSLGFVSNEDPIFAQGNISSVTESGNEIISDAAYEITNTSVDSSLPGSIESAPSMSSMMEDFNDENGIEFMGVLLRIPDGWQTIGKADDKFAMILPDNPDVKISISGGTPDGLGIYGTPQAWLDAEYDDMTNNVNNRVLTIKQTGVCRAGDVYNLIWASEEDDGLSLNAEALITGNDGTYYRFSMTYPIATGTAGSSDSLTERANQAIENFSEVLFLAKPL